MPKKHAVLFGWCLSTLILFPVCHVFSQEKRIDPEPMTIIKAAPTAQQLYVFGYKNEKTNPAVAMAAYREIIDRFSTSELAIKAIERLDRLEGLSTDSASHTVKPAQQAKQTETRSDENAFIEKAANDDVAGIEAFLKAGININTKGTNDFTALMAATRHGCLAAVNTLLKNGADPDIEDSHGNRAIFSAIDQNLLPVVHQFLAHGASINLKNKFGWTALIYAAANGRAEIVDALVKKGADVNGQDNEAKTALLNAADHGHGEIVRKLLKHGADPHGKDNTGSTPLMYISQWHHPDIMMELLQKGVGVNLRNKEGMTALMFAAMKGQTETVQFLLARGAYADARDYKGNNAIKYALAACSQPTVQSLIGSGADFTLYPYADYQSCPSHDHYKGLQKLLDDSRCPDPGACSQKLHNVLFWGGPGENPKEKQGYARKDAKYWFAQSKTTKIHWQLNFADGSDGVDHDVTVVVFRPDGAILYEKTVKIAAPSNDQDPSFYDVFGPPEGQKWEKGFYKVDFYLDAKKMVGTSFEIYPDEPEKPESDVIAASTPPSVSDSAAPVDNKEKAAAFAVGIVSTQQKSLNIRNGAGEQYSVIGKAAKGDKVTILEDSGQWLQIRLPDGAIGYAYKKYIQSLP
jgi:ankyrin repeat protein